MALVFEENFTGATQADVLTEIAANGGTTNLTTSDIVTGYSGYGANITSGKYLYYPTLNNFNFTKGTIQMRVSPNWDLLDLTDDLYFLQINYTTGKQFLWYYNFYTPATKFGNTLFYPNGIQSYHADGYEPYSMFSWKKNTWHIITAYWDFTITASGSDVSYMMVKFDDVYGNSGMVIVATQLTDPGIGAGVNMYFGTDDANGHALNAVIDSIAIYDESLLPDGLGTGGYVRAGYPWTGGYISAGTRNPSYFFNPQTAGTETTFRNLFPTDGICSAWETNATNPSDCPILGAGINPDDDVIFFKRSQFEEVFPGYVPTTDDINASFTYKVFPGEKHTIFFNVYTRIDLTNVNVSCGSFSGGGITDKDLRVVKNWFQGDRNSQSQFDGVPAYVPELLLHNDTVTLETDATLGWDKVPTLPILTSVTTAMDQYTSKQFVLRVTIPGGTAAGTYTATITLTADGGVSVQKVITLTVKGFALISDGKSRGMFLDNYYDATYFAHAMSLDIWDVIRKQYAGMLDIGIDQIILFATNDGNTNWSADGRDAAWQTTSLLSPQVGTATPLEVLRNKLKCAQVEGVDNIVYYGQPSQYTSDALAAIQTEFGYDPWFYGQDEFAYDPPNYTYQNQITASKTVHDLILGHMLTSTHLGRADMQTYLDNLSTYNAEDPVGDASIQKVDYNIFDYNDFWRKIAAGTITFYADIPEGYYWQSRDGNPLYHRFAAGFMPHILEDTNNRVVTRLISSNCMAWSGPAYDEFIASYGPTRAYGYFYPAIDGTGVFNLIPTFNGEVFREGVRDGKLLATWKYYYDLIVGAHPTEAAASLAVINGIKTKLKNYFLLSTAVFALPTADEWDTDRETIIGEIQTLKDLVDYRKIYLGGMYCNITVV